MKRSQVIFLGGGGGVSSVNSQTGTVVLTAGDVGAAPVVPAASNLAATTAIPSSPPPFQYNYYKELSGNLTVTDSGTPVEGGGYTLVLIGDGSSRTFTFPSSYSEAQGGNITSFTVGANEQYTITRRYINGGWRIYGDPATSSGGSNILSIAGTSTEVINNTIDITTVYGPTVPANTLSTNLGVRLLAFGTLTNVTGSNQTLTLTIRYGTTVMYADTTPNIGSSGTARPWRVELHLFGDGATNAQRLEGAFTIGPAASATTGYGDLAGTPIIFNFAPFGGTAAEDSTGALALDVRMTLSTNSTNYTVTRHKGVLLRL